jgi:ubiquinol-cytochrome c reductase cytochrome b subunit
MKRFGSFGSGLLLLALIAVLTGIALLPFYRPVAGQAHASVAAIQASPLLRVVRSVHYWTSALLILLGAATLVYGLFTCSYRRPWQLAWVATIGLVLTFLFLQLTGHLLPWDKHAVSTTAIETGVAENVPVVGPMQARVLRGGDAVGARTLTVWYVAHVALLPVLLAGLAWLFLSQLRRHGMRWAVPWQPLAAVLVALLVLALAAPAPLGPEATPVDYSSYAARSEWYVLPLHGLLSIAQRIRPELAFVGTVGIPGLVVLVLLLLPWLDRRRIGEPLSRVVHLVAALGLAGAMVLILTNLGSMAPLFGPKTIPDARVASVRSTTGRRADRSAPASPGSVPLDPALVAKGKSLVQQNGCLGCHKIAGQGGAVGPSLDGVGARHPDLDWQIRHLKDPIAVVPGSTMPPYKQLSDADLKALATYLLSLK